MTPALMHLRAAENSRWERGRARPQRADRREVFVSSFKTIFALSADGDVRAPSKMKFLILKLITSMIPIPIDKKAAFRPPFFLEEPSARFSHRPMAASKLAGETNKSTSLNQEVVSQHS